MMKILWSVKNDGAPLECVRVVGVRQVTLFEFSADHRGFHNRAVKEIALEVNEARMIFEWLRNRPDHPRIRAPQLAAVFAHGFAVCGDDVGMGQQIGGNQFTNDSRHTARVLVIFAQVFARRLHVDEQGHLVAKVLPVIIVQRHPKMPCYCIQVDRRVG